MLIYFHLPWLFNFTLANHLTGILVEKKYYKDLVFHANLITFDRRYLMSILNEINPGFKKIRMQVSVMHLINIGNNIGLPIKLLKEVYLGNYAVLQDKNSDGGSTDSVNKIITLPLGIAEILGKTAIDGITKEAKAIGLLYHEATHAFIDNKLEASDATLHLAHGYAEKYYRNGTFEDGTKIPLEEMDSAVTEAAAWYVHVQILTWWLMREIMREISIKSPESPNHTHIKASIPNATMQDLRLVRDLINRKNFGLSRAGGDTYKKINMPICPELKVYCDQIIMERKIDNYNIAGLLRFLRV